jgi:tRNA A37 threonylcarbamoyltransferase TsaD
MNLTTDNGTMVAGIGYYLDPLSSAELNSIPDLRVEEQRK